MVAVAEHIKVPELRFPEFSGEWERGIFDDFVEGFTSGSTPSRSIPEYFKGDIPWVNSGDLDYKIIQSTPQNITEKAVIDTNLKIHQPGTFLMAITGLEAAGTRGSCAILGVNATTNQSCMALHVRGSKDIKFFYQFYLSVGQRYAFRYCQGTKQQSYNGQLVRKLPIAFPNEPTEQQKIAEFLTAVDEKIGNLKRKKELLEAYKKGAMQKLFSQEIRFKDDQGNPYPDWEEKRLGDVANISKGKGLGKVDLDPNGITACIRYAELYTLYSEVISDVQSRTSVNASELVLSTGGEVIIPASGESAIDIATSSCVKDSGVALGGDLNIIHSPYCGEFLAYMLSGHLNMKIASLAQGSSVMHLYPAQLKLLRVLIPSLPEQQKIAELLTGIDDKITAVANQIDKAAEFKKGLLQKMFV